MIQDVCRTCGWLFCLLLLVWFASAAAQQAQILPTAHVGDIASDRFNQTVRPPALTPHTAEQAAAAYGEDCYTTDGPLFLRLHLPQACVFQHTDSGNLLPLDPGNDMQSRNITLLRGCGSAFWTKLQGFSHPRCVFYPNVGAGRECQVITCLAGAGYVYRRFEVTSSLSPTYTCRSDGSFALTAHGAVDAGLACKPCPSGTFNNGSSHACRPWTACLPGQQVGTEGTAIADRECTAASHDSASQPPAVTPLWVVVSTVLGLVVIGLLALVAMRKRRQCAENDVKQPWELTSLVDTKEVNEGSALA
eukprot:m.497051 g.497051  ORF g.497051 m.497051 type:complete len:305 (+) comp49970_c0_seq1:193-1107(+)